MRGYTVKENHNGPAVSEIDRQRSFYLIKRISLYTFFPVGSRELVSQSVREEDTYRDAPHKNHE